uniref:Uncharacterized protein MANES_02G218800 n=1 Tax=Rhizophora mucronata TaxID=61149 RepID=A0A2P2MXM1_RHIMU
MFSFLKNIKLPRFNKGGTKMELASF